MTNVAENNSSKLLNTILALTSIAMVLYHMIYLYFPMVNSLLHQNIHLAFSMIILGLMGMRTAKTNAIKAIWALVIVASIVTCTFIHIEYERLHMFAGFPEFIDMIFGIILVALVVGVSFVHWGLVFPLLTGIAVLYAFFGHHLTGPLAHSYLDPKLVLSNMGIGFEGVYGMMLNTSANLIFFFVIFGSLFEAVGITKFFQSIGRFIGGKMRGGAAIGSITSSSLLGTCTGGSMVNVALAGSFTMPMMTEAKFKPTIAGGIEACSSTAGGLTPPVMGIAIFIMASFLNIPYIQLVPATVIPAIIFYFGLIFGVILIIQKENIPMCGMSYDPIAIKQGLPVFVIPIAVLCFLLFSHYAPAYAGFWTVITLIIVSSLRKETRFTPKTLIEGLTKGCVSMASLAIVLAVIGIFITMINLTNVGPKLAEVIKILSGGSVLLSLFLTMILCILLGCALPAPIAYMVVALVVAPGMSDLGVSIVATHLFCFYFSFLSNVTPPIAGSAMVAAKMLNVSFMETAWVSFKFSLPFFVVPYFVIFNPVIILQAQDFTEASIALIMLFTAAAAIAIATWGYFRGHLSIIERSILAISAIIATISGLESGNTSMTLAVIGFGLFIMVIGYRYKVGESSSLFPKHKPEELECVIE